MLDIGSITIQANQTEWILIRLLLCSSKHAQYFALLTRQSTRLGKMRGELRVRLAPWNRFEPSSKIFYWPFQGGTSFVDHLCYWHAFASVHCGLVGTCWERIDLLALVCELRFLSLCHVVSWVRCGTWLYRFLIFATFLTFKVSKQLGPKQNSQLKNKKRSF